MTPERDSILQNLPVEDRPVADRIFLLLDKIRDDMLFVATQLPQQSDGPSDG